MRRFLALLAIIATLILVSVNSASSQAPAKATKPALVIDSTAVLISLVNYWPVSAHLYVSLDGAAFVELGEIPAGAHALLPLASCALGAAKVLTFKAMPSGSHEVIDLGISTREAGRLTLTRIQLGEPPPPPTRA